MKTPIVMCTILLFSVSMAAQIFNPTPLGSMSSSSTMRISTTTTTTTTPSLTTTTTTTNNNVTPHRVTLYAGTKIDASELSDVVGNGNVNLYWQLNSFLGVSGIANISRTIETENVDSIKLSSLYFPDFRNSSGTFSVNIRLNQNHPTFLFAEGSFQARKWKHALTDSTSREYQINQAHFLIGLNYKWMYTQGSYTSRLSAGIYSTNAFILSDISQNSINTLFSDYRPNERNNIPKNHLGWGIMIGWSINEYSFFIRTFDDFNRRGDLALNIGLRADFKVFSF